jgi:hypothetical protein
VAASIVGALVLAGVGIRSCQGLPRRHPVTNLLLGLLVPDDTRYAARFSDSAFRRIEVGIREAEVVALLGEPLATRTFRGSALVDATGALANSGDEPREDPGPGASGESLEKIWFYSMPGVHHDSFHVRVVRTSGDGHVTSTSSWFYVD